jgi:hypothetical protein
MKRLTTLVGASLVACSPIPQSESGVAPATASRPIIIGTAADIQKAHLLAQRCKLNGTTVGKLNSYPALYIDRSLVGSISPASPAWECFTVGLTSGEFSGQLGFVGTEAKGPQ